VFEHSKLACGLAQLTSCFGFFLAGFASRFGVLSPSGRAFFAAAGFDAPFSSVRFRFSPPAGAAHESGTVGVTTEETHTNSAASAQQSLEQNLGKTKLRHAAHLPRAAHGMTADVERQRTQRCTLHGRRDAHALSGEIRFKRRVSKHMTGPPPCCRHKHRNLQQMGRV